MVLRKSHSKGTKFWGCTMWKETECSGSAPYYGDGARAGIIIDIREIKNGYIITTTSKYAESSDGDDPIEQHVTSINDLKVELKQLFDGQVDTLCKQIEESTEFVDEIDTEKHEKRVQAVKRGTTDVGELIKRIADTKRKAEAVEAESAE